MERDSSIESNPEQCLPPDFDTYYNAEVCDPGYNRTAAMEALTAAYNATANGTVPELPTCQREISVLYLLLLLGTAWLGVMLYNFTTTSVYRDTITIYFIHPSGKLKLSFEEHISIILSH